MANHPVVILATSDTAGAVSEFAGATTSLAQDTVAGLIEFTDVDVTDVHTATVKPLGVGYVGKLTLGAVADSTGGTTGSVAWTFSVADGVINFLAAGETLVQTYSVTINDGHGGASVQTIAITITGTNDAPTIAAANTTAAGSVTELAATTGSLAADVASGVVAFRDVDRIDAHTVTVTPKGAGYLGSFTVDTLADSTGGVVGSVPWSFSVADGALDFLGAGQTRVQKYDVAISDGQGGTAVQTVTITLIGSNDDPVVTTTDAQEARSITEHVGLAGSPAQDAVGGVITFKDADRTDTHTLSVAPQGADYLGTFSLGAITDSTLGAVGAAPWSFSVTDGALDFLAAGETRVQNYDVTVSDGHGGTALQTVSITLAGTNDAPVAQAAGSLTAGSVTEFAGPTSSTLVDLASGALAFTDLDLTDTHTATVKALGVGYVGKLTLGAVADSTGGITGTVPWTFSVADSVINFLAAGETLVQNYSVTVNDGHGGTAVQTIAITITGTNDAPTIAAANTTAAGSVTELAATTGSLAADVISGVVAFKDADRSDAHTVTVTPKGAGYLGNFTVGALTDTTGGAVGAVGSVPWSFSVADGALDGLAAGETRVQKYDVAIGDGQGGTAIQTVSVTLVGKNDAPVVSVPGTSAAATVTELAATTASVVSHDASGTVAFTDPDLSDVHAVSVASQGLNYLGAFSLGTASDSTGGAAGSVPWSFSVQDAALDGLAAGQTLVQSYKVAIDDGHGGAAVQTVSVTLVGSNDAPTIAAAGTTSTGAVTEVAATTGSLATDTATGAIAFNDLDLIDTHSATVAALGTGYLGSLKVGAIADSSGGATGAAPWTFAVADGALDFLAAGQTLVQSYAVTLDDHHGGTASQTVTVTLTGSNDAPTVAAGTVASGTVVELAATAGSAAVDTAAGTIAFTDPDLTDGHVVSVAAEGLNYLGAFALGTMTDSTGGAAGAVPWSFAVADGALDTLAAGQTLVQNYDVTIDDGHGGTLTRTVAVTLAGSNDAPTIAAAGTVASGAVSERLGLTGSPLVDSTGGVVAFNDIDAIDTHTASVTALGTGYVGSVTLGTVADSTGGAAGSVAWTFSAPDGALDVLAAGQTVVQSYSIAVADGHGGTATQTVSVTLTGTNDAPIAQPIAADVNEHGPGVGLAAIYVDPDRADVDRVLVNTAGTVGVVTDNGNGTFGYDPGGHFASLAAGQTATDTFLYVVDDGHGGVATQTATVTVHGQNDAPVANADTIVVNGATTGNLWSTVLANDTDVDTAHAALTITSVNTAGTHGILAFNPVAQTLVYTPVAGGAGTDSFAYTISDGQGGASTATVTLVTDHVVNDSLVVTAGQTATFAPAAVLANDTAFDGGPMTLVSVSGAHVALSLGNLVYTAPAAGTSDSFTYTAQDSNGGIATGTVSVALANSAAVVVGNAAAQAEWLVGTGASPITMTGGGGADHLVGSTGADTITGGAGADTITGGAGPDHFVFNYGGAATPNSDSSMAAMDIITDFHHGGGANVADFIDLNGFNFIAAGTANVTAATVTSFTSTDVVGYFADGNAVHDEHNRIAPTSSQIYVDANGDGNFEVASDIVIHLNALNAALTTTDILIH